MNESPVIEAEVLSPMWESRPHYVYICRHVSGAVLYVGSSLNVMARLAQHKGNTEWFQEVKCIDVERYANREDALNRERQLIARSLTALNVQHIDPLAAFLHFFWGRKIEQRADLITKLFEWYFKPSEQARVLRLLAGTMEKAMQKSDHSK